MVTPIRLPDGREYASIAEACRKLGVSRTTFVKYLDNGDLETVAKGKFGPGKGQSITVDGIEYRSLRQFSLKYGHNPVQVSRLVSRMAAQGIPWTSWRGHKVEINLKEFNT